MNARNLIFVDGLFRLPYIILRYFMSFGSDADYPPPGPVIIIKFMGMGSLTLFASYCDESLINRSQIILITFDKQKEICRLLGFTAEGTA